MSLPEISIKKPVTVVTICALVVIMAVFLLPSLPVDLFPDVQPPILMLMTSYSNMGPETVEKNITEVLEKQCSSLEGLDEMTSYSRNETSLIVFSFNYDVDLEDAKNDLRDIVNRSLDYLPDDVETPVILEYDINSQPIAELGIEGDLSLSELQRLGEDIAQPLVERVAGVASAEVSGGPDPVIWADISLNRLEAYGLTISQAAQALGSLNIAMSGGEISGDDQKFLLQTDGEFSSIEQIGNAVIMVTTGGIPVRLSDLAEVYEGAEEESSRIYINGKPGVFLSVIKESDTNSINVVNGIRKKIPVIQKKLPSGVTLRFLTDETTMISSTMSEVYSSAFSGALLAMLILFLFLRSFKSTLVIGFSIPLSLLVTFIVMYFMGLTLNLLTMTGLVLGIGMMVDSSIVILENITKYRERGIKLSVATVIGSQEMMTALMASTLTTICVFAPMLIWKDQLGMLGQIFQDMIVTIVVSLVSSLVVALTLVPALSANYFKINTSTQRQYKNRILRAVDNVLEKALVALENAYKRALGFCLRNKALVLTFTAVTFFLALAQFSTLGLSFSPRSSSDEMVTIDLTMPPGTTLEKTDRALQQMRVIIEENITGYESIIVQAGPSSSLSSDSSTSGSIKIILPSLGKQTLSAGEIKNILRRFVNIIPDAEWAFSSGRYMGSSSAIDIKIACDDLDASEKTAGEIIALIRKEVPEVLDPESSLDEGSPEYTINIDRERAADLNLSVNDIATAVYQAVSGTVATVYRSGGDEIDIRLRLREEDRNSVQNLEALPVTNSAGTRILLSNVAQLETALAPKSIERKDETRIVHITGDLAEGAAVSAVQGRVEQVIGKNIIFPEGMSVSYGGDMEDLSEYGPQIIIVLIAALILVFGVMASQFESFKDPFIIFFTIPLLAIGVTAVYKITGQTFSLFSAIGVIALLGVVVNSGIILVDYTNLLRKRGIPLEEACMEGGRSRLRPILMTSLTTILGMVPMAFFPGEGTDMIRPLGQTMVGGMISSTIMTLFVIPVIYALLNKPGRKKVKKEAVA